MASAGSRWVAKRELRPRQHRFGSGARTRRALYQCHRRRHRTGGSDTARALVERLDSPRDAVAALFAVPDGRISALADNAIAELADGVFVTLLDGTSRDRPSIEIRDHGSGISAGAMTTSILDLAGSNKLDKPYLAGAYGQGGSTTFAFTGAGSLIASSPDGRDGAVTFVRYRALDPRKNKNGRYEFMVDPQGAVPRFDAAAVGFVRGTLVRHFSYDLPRHAGSLDSADGLVALASAALFDPVLPLRLHDKRSYRRGSRERLFAGAVRAFAHAGDLIELHQSLGIPLGRRGTHGLVSIRYWLLASNDAAIALRLDDRNAVFITNFGQTHDVWGRAFVVDDLRYPFLKAALIVQVELDALTAGAKRELLSSTRDRLKRGALFTALQTAVRDALADEPALQEANAQRRRRLLAKQHAADHERLQRRFAELMDAFRPGVIPAVTNGKHGEANPASVAGDTVGLLEPLPTLDHPTFMRFATGGEPLALPHGRNVRVVLESDAPDAYVARYPGVRLILAPDPPDALVFVRSTDFRNGRARVVMRADAAIGTTGTVAARLTDATGAVLATAATFSVTPPPPPQPADPDGDKRISVPNVFEITRERWHEYAFDERSVATVNESRDDISIFVNVDNVHLVNLVERVHYQQTGLTRLRSAFVIQTAFYAFLQHRAQAALGLTITGDDLERYVREEYDRLAQTVVSSIAAVDRIESASLLA